MYLQFAAAIISIHHSRAFRQFARDGRESSGDLRPRAFDSPAKKAVGDADDWADAPEERLQFLLE